MIIEILNHNDTAKGTKQLLVRDVYSGLQQKVLLSGRSYDNFVRYAMYLWSDGLKTTDVRTKIKENAGAYCFYPQQETVKRNLL